MAILLAESNINLTSSSWKTIDSATFLNSEVTGAFLTTTFVGSSTFTPGAITIDGIMVRLYYYVANTGTVTLELYNNTAATVSGTTVIINVSDLPPQTLASLPNSGYVYFKFSSPVTLLAATLYSVRLKSSVTNNVAFCSSTGTNWSRALVKSATTSPVAGDNLYIVSPSASYITVTMDNTSVVTFGSLEFGAYGKMVLENSPSKNYLLSIANAGSIKARLNSIMEFGNSTTRIDSSSTFKLELQSTSIGGNYLMLSNLATFRMYGAQRLRKAQLAANSSIGATTLTTDVSTGWKSGDNIVFGSTLRTNAVSYEKKVLTADAVGTTLSITAMTNAKLGTAPIQCDIGNVTSNAMVYGTSTSGTFFISSGFSGQPVTNINTLDVDNVEFRYGGGFDPYYGTINIYGQTTANINYNITNCGFHDGANGYRGINTQGSVSAFNIQNNTFYRIGTGVVIASTLNTSGTKIISNNLMIGGVVTGIQLGNNGSVFNDITEVKNNIASACYTGFTLGTIIDMDNKFTDNRATCSLGGIGFSISAVRSNFSNLVSTLNFTYGMTVNQMIDCSIDGFTSFGNTTGDINIAGLTINSRFLNMSLDGYAGNATQFGIIQNSIVINSSVERSTFGTSVKHTTAATTMAYDKMSFKNCTIADTTIMYSQLNGINNYSYESRVGFQRNNGVAGNHITYKNFGSQVRDSVIYDGSPNSIRLIPISAAYKLRSTTFQISVASGSTATVSIKVRKSVVGDGTAYNGTQPRLILKSNPSAGSSFNTDVICATASAAAGTWETLSYTTPVVTDNVGLEFYVDCSGNNGWVNVDTFVSNNNNSMKYYNNGEPINDISTGGGEKSFTFVG